MRNRRQAGYSLAELLTVVAIIGTMSLVSVPAFMRFYWSNKMKTSLRQVTTDLRNARQRAITENHPTMVSYDIGANKRQFRSYNGAVATDGTVTWTELTAARTQLEDIIYIDRPASCLFANDVEIADASGWNDIIFLPNGTIQNIPPAPCAAGKLLIKTNYKVPRPQIVIDLYSTGRLKAN
jgi:prepilin-type N-terminal cleavage/methylation domain-containing protein